MTNEEIVQEIQNGINVTENMELLYKQNQRMIYKIAKPLAVNFNLEDLVQESYFALDKAVKAYDPEKECSFIGLLCKRVYWHLIRYLKNNGQLKRIPLYLQYNIRNYHKAVAEFEQREKRKPNTKEIAEAMEISETKVNQLEKVIYESTCKSLDAPLTTAEDSSLNDIIPGGDEFEENSCDRIALESIWDEVERLPEREKILIKEYYQDNKTYDEIGDYYNISRQRVNQIIDKGGERLSEMSRVKELAESYGYDCSQSYKYGVNCFRRTGTSSTEYLALKHIELENQMKQNNTAYDEIMQMIIE